MTRSKFFNSLIWFILTACTLGCLYLGINGDRSAVIVFVVVSWLDCIGSLTYLNQKDKNTKKFLESYYDITYGLMGLVDLLTVGVLIYFGWYWTAVAAFIAAASKVQAKVHYE